MKNLFNLVATICLFFISANNLISQETSEVAASAYSFGASYNCDIAGNARGGIKRGASYLGLLNLKGNVKTNVFGSWGEGLFSVNLASSHGKSLSDRLVGDFQGVSNIEAGNAVFFFELSYKHTYKNISICLGLQDMNAVFDVCDYAGNFINSSFGIQSAISDNINASIFPRTVLGAVVQWQASEKVLLKCAVFDGTNDDSDAKNLNLAWKLNNKDGLTAIVESNYSDELISNLKSSVKLGYYYHDCYRASDKITSEEYRFCNYGAYIIAEQEIEKFNNDGALALFSQLAFAPKKNYNSNCASLGINAKGLCSSRPEDVIGLAVSRAGFNTADGNETAFECFYQLQVSNALSIKPDIQFIRNPSGKQSNINNALVAFLRIGVNI